MIIARGTTPTIECVIPEELPLDTAKEIWVTIKQGGTIVVDRTLTSSGVTIGENTIFIKLTQEETLQFNNMTKTIIGLRILLNDDNAYSSYINKEAVICIMDTIKEGVIDV